MIGPQGGQRSDVYPPRQSEPGAFGSQEGFGDVCVLNVWCLKTQQRKTSQVCSAERLDSTNMIQI